MALDLDAPPPKLQSLESGDLVTMVGTQVVCVFDQAAGVANESPEADWALAAEDGDKVLKSLTWGERVLIGGEEFEVDFNPFTMSYPVRFKRPA